MSNNAPPTALDQLTLLQWAQAGVVLPQRPVVNITSGATLTDDPTFEVNGETVGATDVTIEPGPGYTFVFQPGGVATGNVYTSFATLYAALPAADAHGHRPPWLLSVDDSFVSPAVIPAAAYNFDNGTFSSTSNVNNNRGGAVLTIAAGSTVVASSLRFRGNIQVQYLGSAAPLITLTGTEELNVTITEQAQVSCTERSGSAAPFIAVTSSGAFCWVTIITGLLGDDDLGNTTFYVSAGNGEVVATAGGFCAFGALLGNISLNWTDVLPETQGAGVAVMQIGGKFTATLVPIGGVSGADGAPYFENASGNIGLGSSGTLVLDHTFAPYMMLLLASSGLTGDVTVQLPSTTVGYIVDVDLTAVPFSSYKVIFTTGSGTTVSVNATQLAATGQTGVRVGVSASNQVTRFS